MISKPILWGAVIVGMMVTHSPEVVRAQARIEIRPVETVTVTTKQFLVADKNGRPTTLAAELRVPTAGTGKLPAVILGPGSGGIHGFYGAWADALYSIRMSLL